MDRSELICIFINRCRYEFGGPYAEFDRRPVLGRSFGLYRQGRLVNQFSVDSGYPTVIDISVHSPDGFLNFLKISRKLFK